MAAYKCKHKHELVFVSVNVRSLRANFDELLIFLENQKITFDVLGITETWIKKEESFAFEIPGYKMFVQERSTKLGGGVALYVKNNLLCSATDIISEECNGIQFNISGLGAQNVTGALLYRFCRSSVTKFLTTLENLGCSLTGHAIIFGDINLNISPPHNNNAYLNVMASMGFEPVVVEPTRIQGETRTCIDHIFQRFPTGRYNVSNLTYKLLDVQFSDHRLTKFSLPLACDQDISDRKPRKKEISVTNWNKVSEKISAYDWARIHRLTEVNESFDQFIEQIHQIIDSETTSKSSRELGKRRSPWVTDDLVKLSESKLKLHKLAKKYPDNVFLKAQLKKIIKAVKSKIKSDKKSYYSRKLELCGSDPKKYWGLIKGTLSSPQIAVEKIETEHGGIIKTAGNEKVVANAFNSFFIDKVSEILNSAPGLSGDSGMSQSNVNQPPTPRLDRTFRLFPITRQEVSENLKKLPNKLSKGSDGITSIFLKNNSEALVPTLTWLFNFSISKGIFPERLKEAIVVPLYKNGNRTLLTNYRPISLLSTISKLFEKIIHGRLLSFWTKYGVFSHNQFGFLPKKSTEMAVFSQMKEVVQGIEEGDFVAAVYFDIMKAFDAVKHTLLIKKLEKFGIRGYFLDWFRTYLIGRKQKVKINNVLSDAKVTASGVPQGSCLGPLLFLVYINDILSLDLRGSIFAYADDTAVLYRDKSRLRLIEKMNSDMRTLRSCFTSHYLLPNIKKTKLLSFGYKKSVDLRQKIKLHVECNDTSGGCKCEAIEQVPHWKYLGLYLDSRLSWAEHLTYLNKKIRKLCLLLYYASKHFGRHHLLRIYTAIIEPNFRFGIPQWGSAGSTALIPLERLQRKAVRTIAGIKIGQNSSRWLTKLNILSISELHKLELSTFAQKYKSSASYFISSSGGRASDGLPGRSLNLVPPAWYRVKSRAQAPFSAVLVYNELPNKIKVIVNHKIFRKKAAEHITGRANLSRNGIRSNAGAR